MKKQLHRDQCLECGSKRLSKSINGELCKDCGSLKVREKVAVVQGPLIIGNPSGIYGFDVPKDMYAVVTTGCRSDGTTGYIAKLTVFFETCRAAKNVAKKLNEKQKSNADLHFFENLESYMDIPVADGNLEDLFTANSDFENEEKEVIELTEEMRIKEPEEEPDLVTFRCDNEDCLAVFTINVKRMNASRNLFSCKRCDNIIANTEDS